MSRFRIAALGLAAYAVLMVCSHTEKHDKSVDVAREELTATSAPAPTQKVPELALAPSTPRPFGLLMRFGEVRLLHPGPVRSLALSGDGKTLATTTRNESVLRLWDATTGWLVHQVRIRTAEAGTVSLVGFSSDARQLLAVRQLKLSDREFYTEREWGLLNAETGDFRALGKLASEVAPPVVSPDGTMIGGISERGELTIWAFAPDASPRVLGVVNSGPLPGRDRVAFSPDGKQVVACRDQTLFVVSTDGSSRARELKVGINNYRYYSAAYWPRSDRIVAVHEAMMTAVDPTTGQEIAHTDRGMRLQHSTRLPGGMIFGNDFYSGERVAIHPDTLVPAPASGIWKKIPGGMHTASADGKILACINRHAVRLVDAMTGELLLPDLDRTPAEPADRFDFSADGRRMIASGGATAQTWDVPNGRLLASFPAVPAGDFNGPPRVGLSPDGRWAITSSTFDMRTVARDAETGKVAGDPQQYKEKLFAGFDRADRVWLWDRYGLDLTSYSLPGGPAGRTLTPPPGFLLFSPDSRWLVSSSSRAALQIRDTRAANPGWLELESYRDQGSPACGRVPSACAVPVRFSPDGRYLVTWWRGFNLWHVAERTPRVVRLTEVRDQGRWYPDATFSPDGRRMAAVVTEEKFAPQPGQVGGIRIWETASGSEAFRFDPPGGATGCAFTPDGKRLVVAHPDTTFSVWDYAALESRAVRVPGDSWDRLGSRDAKVGLGAIDALVAGPAAVEYLRERFQPADAKLVARLVAELGDADYATREAAEKGLAALRERAEKALFEAVTTSPSAEVRDRAARLLKPISGPHSIARLRAGRAVEVLERIGTPAAKALLSEWAKGAPALAAEANAALGRLARPR